ncbi:MAG: 3-phosphoserine/phosphohydroxythreonine transaminase [Deltaproteobacteria bacterium]|nr:3-phosphoserine/phosphohydroxythreonine transaminase [Deltaproteobacteria bacterium]
MKRVHNFNAGPSALPLSALELARDELLDFEGSGMSILEHSHRGKEYEKVHDETLGLIRSLMAVPETHDILLLQGGAHQQFAQIPMNLLMPGQSADYVLTGGWSERAYEEAKNVGTVRLAATTGVDHGGKTVYRRIPRFDELQLHPEAAYVHITSNNTLFGTQWAAFPETKAPLVIDMSSDIMSRPVDVSKIGLIYAGAQKNVGPSGITIVIIHKDLVQNARKDIPKIFRYSTHAKERSLYNTPPTFAVYLARNVLRWVKELGGLTAIEARNRQKTDVLYAAIDSRPDFYKCPVEQGSRSRMNIVFNLPTPALEDEFVAAAKKKDMVGLKGHRSVGGIRVSTYNAVEPSSIDALVAFMDEFARSKA